MLIFNAKRVIIDCLTKSIVKALLNLQNHLKGTNEESNGNPSKNEILGCAKIIVAKIKGAKIKGARKFKGIRYAVTAVSWGGGLRTAGVTSGHGVTSDNLGDF